MERSLCLGGALEERHSARDQPVGLKKLRGKGWVGMRREDCLYVTLGCEDPVTGQGEGRSTEDWTGVGRVVG